MTTVVCLPGLLCTPDLYRRVLSGLDAPAQAIDLPHGDDFAQVAAEIASQLSHRTVLVGTSMGSYLALEVARQVPKRVAGLVLLGCTAKSDTPKAAAMREKVVAWARREGIDALAETICDSMLGEAAKADAGLRAEVAQMARAQGLEVFADHQTALAGRPDNTAALPGISCPVLVMTGAQDTVTLPEVGRAVADALPNGRFTVIEGAGHLAALEKPEIVADAINGFLACTTQPATAST